MLADSMIVAGAVGYHPDKGRSRGPSNDPKDVVVQWTRKLAAPRSALEVLTLVPDSDVTLGPQEAYWVRIAAWGEDSAIEWLAAAEGLRPQWTRSADRVRGSEWRPRVSPQGPGLGFRAIARPGNQRADIQRLTASSSLKVKRSVVADQNKRILDAFYT